MPHLLLHPNHHHHQTPLITYFQRPSISINSSSLSTITTCCLVATKRCKPSMIYSARTNASVGVASGPHQSMIRITRCMANPRRVKMVAKQIRRELSDILLTDKVLQYAVLPEAALGADRYLSSLTTISDVEVSADLQVVKVYVSVFGDERGREIAISGLKSKEKYVRSQLGRRMKLRLTPEIRFIEDESIERGSRVIAILDRIKNEKKMAGSQDDDQNVSYNQSQDDSDWGANDPDDEGIIYVK